MAQKAKGFSQQSIASRSKSESRDEKAWNKKRAGFLQLFRAPSLVL